MTGEDIAIEQLYAYPRTRFVDENTIEEQMYHLLTEVTEAYKELLVTGKMHRLAQELRDIGQSAETALRILEERHDIDTGEAKRFIIRAARSRGHYDKA